MALGLVAGAAASLYWAVVLRPLPSNRGVVRLPGMDAPAEVLWDEWGVPHVYAESDDDAWLLQGYLHARDRLWQMEFQRRVACGRLSELFGARTLESDRTLRRLGFRRAAEAEAAALDEASARMLAAYCAGVNACLRQSRRRLPVEFTLLRHQPEPWSPVDTLAWGKLMAWTLSLNWDMEIAREWLAQALDPGVLAYLRVASPTSSAPPVGSRAGGAEDRLEEATPGGAASNAWAVHGSRTATGKPLLASDPHLMPQLPSPWYEVHLCAPGFAVTGASLPGAPGVFIGHNRQIAWGITAAMADTQDTYLEEVRRSEGLYRVGDGWKPATVVREAIWVKGQPEPEMEDVVVTRHGPVLVWRDGGAYGYAVQSPTLQANGVAGVLRLAQASDWASFQAAVADWPWAALNFIYADVHGNIGYQLAGRVPRRPPGAGQTPAPGWADDHEWAGYLGLDELPHELNPARGYVANCNNRPSSGWRPELGEEWADAYRAQRVEEVLANGRDLTRAQMAELQMDTLSLAARELIGLLRSVPLSSPTARRALSLLEDWDCRITTESGAALLYAAVRRRLLRGLLQPLLGDHVDAYFGQQVHPLYRTGANPFQSAALLARLLADAQRGAGPPGRTLPPASQVVTAALEAAWQDVTLAQGPDPARWRWGRAHALRLHHPLAVVPPLAWLFDRGPYPVRGDIDTVHQASYSQQGTTFEASRWAPSYRFIADLADWDRCQSVHLPGQSGQPGSRHYDDQVALWRAGALHAMPFTRPAVEAAAVSRQRFLPLAPAAAAPV